MVPPPLLLRPCSSLLCRPCSHVAFEVPPPLLVAAVLDLPVYVGPAGHESDIAFVAAMLELPSNVVSSRAVVEPFAFSLGHFFSGGPDTKAHRTVDFTRVPSGLVFPC